MTTKVRIEWVTLTGDGWTGGEQGAPSGEFGVQELSTTGSSPIVSGAAPYFGMANGQNVVDGVARVSVIQSAAIVAVGPSPAPSETNGYRIVAGDAQDIPVKSGWFVAIVEAADQPAVPGISSVSDAAAESSLASVVSAVEADGASNAAAKLDLDALVTGDGTAHTDAGVIEADLVQLHNDQTAGNADAATANTDLGTLVSGQSSAASQAHGDAGTIEGDITAAQTQAHADAGTVESDLGTVAADVAAAQTQAHGDAGTIEGDITTEGSQAHADAGVIEGDITSAGSQAHADAGTVESDLGTVAADVAAAQTQAHSDAGTIEGDINAAGSQAHTDAGVIEGGITSAGAQAHTDAGVIEADLAGTLKTEAQGTVGADYSSGKPALPNIGANFGGAGPYANYVLLATVPASAARNNVDIENTSGGQIAIVRDDGTGASGAAPANASVFVLAGGAAVGAQGGAWSSQTFKGRLQIYGPTAGLQVAVMVD